MIWLADRDRFGREARVAPLSVAGLLRNRVFAERTTVLTSATLKLGGDFDAVAGSLGLRTDDAEIPWRGLDVGSPFDYPKQGILYTAQSLAPPAGTGYPRGKAEIADWSGPRRRTWSFSPPGGRPSRCAVPSIMPKLTVLQGDAQLSELTVGSWPTVFILSEPFLGRAWRALRDVFVDHRPHRVSASGRPLTVARQRASPRRRQRFWPWRPTRAAVFPGLWPADPWLTIVSCRVSIPDF